MLPRWQGVSDLSTPEQLEFSQCGRPSLSSAELDWPGLRVNVFKRHRPVERQVPGCTHHLVTVGLAHMDRLFLEQGGRVRDGAILKGESVLVPAGVPSTWSCNHAAAGAIWIYIAPELITRNVADLTYGDPERVEIVGNLGFHDPLVQGIGLAFMAELETGGLGGRLYVESLGAALAAHLIRFHSAFPARPAAEKGGLAGNRLRRTIEFIRDNLGADLSLDELAGHVQMSAFHFARQFRQSTGLSPHRYVLKHRIEKARELLHEGRFTIAEISAELGFASQSHFAVVFRRLVGVTPRTWLQRD
ncbi:MAG: helix-turn-helix domain-containing protein [Candidatus Binataceae bacterium]